MGIHSQAALIGASWAEFGVATILVALRIYTTFFFLPERTNPVAASATFCAVLAWGIGVASAVLIQLSADNGMGLHLSEIPADEIVPARLYSWLSDALTRLSLAAGRAAVVLFISAIQYRSQVKWQKWFLGFIMVSNILVNIGVVFAIFFHCDPPAKLWNAELPGSCASEATTNGFAYFGAAWGAASDFCLAVYPAYLFSYLQIERRTKVTLSILFGLGLFAAACAATTCYELHLISDSVDPTYSQGPLTVWGYTEMWVVVIASCLPPNFPYFKRFAPKISSVSQSVHGALSGSKRSKSVDLEDSSGSSGLPRSERETKDQKMLIRSSSDRRRWIPLEDVESIGGDLSKLEHEDT